MSQNSYMAKNGEAGGEWYLVDAKGQTLGKLATNVAKVLRGKHRPTFTPHALCGDCVVVINAKDVVVSGPKRTGKVYDRYSGYPSGRRERTFTEVMEQDPTFPVYEAVRGMLQHNSLGAEQLTRLRVYASDAHEQTAQKPQPITFGKLGEVVVANRS